MTSASTVDLVIKTINNEIFNYTVDLNTTILSLKSLIRETTSIDEERQRLIYKGRVLTDETIIDDYKIENGHTIHMVARPSNYQELRAQSDANSSPSAISIPSVTTTRASATTSASVIAGSANAGNTSGADNLEHIRQGLLSIHTLISTMNPRDFRQSRTNLANINSYNTVHSNNIDISMNNKQKTDYDGDIMEIDSANIEDDKDSMNHDQEYENDFYTEGSEGEMDTMNSSDNANRVNQEVDEAQISALTRKFFKGQWIDVKDTVSQWLEATVMDINIEESKIFVHYNGWPERWDEWISWDSPRISPFRSRTNHSSLNLFACPTPNVVVSSAPNTGPNDLRLFLPEFAQLFRTLSPLIEEIASLAEDSFSSRPIVGSVDSDNNRSTETNSSTSRSNLRYRGSNSSNNSNVTTATASSANQSMTSGMPWESVLNRYNDNNNNEYPDRNLENERRQKLKSDNNESAMKVSTSAVNLSLGTTMADIDNNQLNTKMSGVCEETVKRENRKRNASTVDPTTADFDRKQISRRTTMMNAQQKEARLNHLAKELCPLVDRFGRVLTDLSPFLRDLAEINNSPTAPTSAASTENAAPLSIEASLLSLLRNRPPSPPPERSYRAPIATNPRLPLASSMRSAGLGLGTNASTATSGFLSELLGSAISNNSNNGGNGSISSGVRTTENGNHVDIHIAILQPQSRTTTTSEGSGLSQAVSSLTASLQAQAQSLAQRTQELTERTQQVSGYSTALNEILRIVNSDEQRIEEINSQIRAIQASSDSDNLEIEPNTNNQSENAGYISTSSNQMEEDEDDEHLNTEILNDLIPPDNEERNNQSLLPRVTPSVDENNCNNSNQLSEDIISSRIEINGSTAVDHDNAVLSSKNNNEINNNVTDNNNDSSNNNGTNSNSTRSQVQANPPAINPPSVLERLRRSFNFGT